MNTRTRKFLLGIDLDADGNPRPATGAWDIGAYQYTASRGFSPSFNLRRVSWEDQP